MGCFAGTCFLFDTDEDHFWYFEVLVLVFKLCMTGLFCIIARDSPFQSVLAFLVCTVYSCLLLRYTPYKADEADLLALTCSFSLALTLLTGYVINATRANYSAKDDEQVLKDSLDILDVVLIVINALPFVVFLFHLVKRFVVGANNKTNGADGKVDDNSSTKILPVAPERNQQSQTAGSELQFQASDAQAIRTFS